MKLKDGFVSIIRGAIIGIGSTVPFMSIGALFLGIGIFDNICDAIGNFFKDIKKNIFVLVPIIIGFVAGFISTKDIMPSLFCDYKEQITLLFIGIIYGEIPFIFNKIKRNKKQKNNNNLIEKVLSSIIFILILLFSLLVNLNINMNFSNGIYTILFGITSSICIFIPGLNYYMINNIFNIPNFSNLIGNNNFTIVYIIGIIIGIILFVKLFNYLYNNHKVLMNYITLSLLLISVVNLCININDFTLNFTTIFTSILTFFWGYILSNKIREE